MKLFTDYPGEKMTDEDVYEYLAKLSKTLMEITMRIGAIERKVTALSKSSSES